MISIIMGLYNAENTVEEAINSILQQTYPDWEFIICDDGSTDNSVNIVKKYIEKDDRIKLIQNKKNMGLNYTLNHCLQHAKGNYIARMDADDISVVNRLEIELKTLLENDVDIVSCAMDLFDENGIWGRHGVIENPQESDFIYKTPFCHAPALIKAESIRAVGGYSVNNKLLRVEDYHLWYKMYKSGFKGINIDKTLYQMRDDRNARNRRKFKYRINESYVKYLIWRDFEYTWKDFIYVLKPILVGLMPTFIYDYMHKHNLSKTESKGE